MERRCRTASTMFPVPASPLERIIAAPSEIRRSASPRLVAPHTNGTVKGHLSMWYASSAGVSTSDSSMKSTPSACENLCLGEVPDPGLGHHRNGDRRDDPLDQHRIAHAGHAPVTADVGRHPLERHDRDGAGVLGDLGLLGVDHVHDHAAAQHVRQAPLDGERPGGHGTSLRARPAGPLHRRFFRRWLVHRRVPSWSLTTRSVPRARTEVTSRSPGAGRSSR